MGNRICDPPHKNSASRETSGYPLEGSLDHKTTISSPITSSGMRFDFQQSPDSGGTYHTKNEDALLKTLHIEPNFAVIKGGEFESEYELGKPLGEGSFGQVHECTMKRLKEVNGQKIKRAVKMIQKTGRAMRDQAKFR